MPEPPGANANALAVVDAVRASRRSGERLIILIDGGSGAGKSDLADLLEPLLGAEVLRLDDIYPGWDGLGATSLALPGILATGRWQRWDWIAGHRAEWNRLDSSRPLVVDGSGSLSRSTRALATLGVWLDLDEATRKQRALDRDGESYAAEWDRWAAQEREFFERERPDLLADLVLPG